MDIILPLLVLIGIGLIGLVAILVAMPLLLRLTSFIEAFGIIGQGFDEYFNRPGLSRGCCLIGLLFVMMACIGCVALVVIGVGCFTGSTSGLCRFIGR